MYQQHIEFHYPNTERQGVVSRVTKPTEQSGRTATIYEFEYDLSQALPEEPLTLEIETPAGNVPKSTRVPFKTLARTGLISVWIILSAERPYKTYSLVCNPADRSRPPRPMTERYSIDQPYGFLIGWSVVNPEEDRVYESRWTTE